MTRFVIKLQVGSSVVLLIALFGCTTIWAANPTAGEKIYAQNCATCHGDDGRGVVPNTTDFSRGEGLFKSDADLLRSIQKGRRAMPGFSSLLTEREILDVIAYLRSLF